MPQVASNPAPPSLPPDHSADDTELIPMAASGSSDAFTTLFNRHYTAIHAFAYRLCLCSAEAEDVAQETFIQAARSLRNFRHEASFKNWLYTIATNRARDRIRQQRRRDRLDNALTAEPYDNHTPAAEPPSGETTPDIARALAALTAEQREAITLVYYENLSHGEAARILGCAESTVSWRVFRAKTRLRKTLRRHHRHD